MRRHLVWLSLFAIAGCCGGTTTGINDEGLEELSKALEEAAAEAESAAATTTSLEGEGTESAPYVATCWTTSKEIAGEVGTTAYVKCPADCTTGFVWGTDTYTADSKICVAAIHAGASTTEGGVVQIEKVAGLGEYGGSERNGITSSDWGSYDISFVFAGVEAAEEEVEAADAPPAKGISGKKAHTGRPKFQGRPSR